jgi:hypothetical protein
MLDVVAGAHRHIDPLSRTRRLDASCFCDRVNDAFTLVKPVWELPQPIAA